MPTTFQVFYLGVAPLIDPIESNATSENAAGLLSATYGSFADPLFDNVQTLSPRPTGYSGGLLRFRQHSFQ